MNENKQKEAGIVPALLSLKLIRQHYVPFSDRTIYRMISTGEFPKADAEIGRKIRLWRRETVERWVDDLAPSANYFLAVGQGVA